MLFVASFHIYESLFIPVINILVLKKSYESCPALYFGRTRKLKPWSWWSNRKMRKSKAKSPNEENGISTDVQKLLQYCHFFDKDVIYKSWIVSATLLLAFSSRPSKKPFTKSLRPKWHYLDVPIACQLNRSFANWHHLNHLSCFYLTHCLPHRRHWCINIILARLTGRSGYKNSPWV